MKPCQGKRRDAGTGVGRGLLRGERGDSYVSFVKRILPALR